MERLMKLFDDDLKELAKMIAERQGYKPTDKTEVHYEKVQKETEEDQEV